MTVNLRPFLTRIATSPPRTDPMPLLPSHCARRRPSGIPELREPEAKGPQDGGRGDGRLHRQAVNGDRGQLAAEDRPKATWPLTRRRGVDLERQVGRRRRHSRRKRSPEP